jgi:hypothetical protein
MIHYPARAGKEPDLAELGGLAVEAGCVLRVDRLDQRGVRRQGVRMPGLGLPQLGA